MPRSILPGAPPTRGSGEPWGMVPQVPDPLDTANLAILGDIANLPSLTDLATQVNQFNTGQAIAPYVANLPGYQSMVGQSSQNIGSLLRGEIPTDVMNLLNLRAAERGLGTGLAGSPNANTAAMRALGLTSLGLQQQGEGELTAAIGRTPVPQLFNVAQWLTSPEDLQAAQMAANIYAAAPDPNRQAQELMRLFEQFMAQMGGRGGGPNIINLPSGRSTPTPDHVNPPVTVAGGGSGEVARPAAQGTFGPPSQVVDYTGRTAGGAAPVTTTPGFPGGPSPTEWQDFLGGVNPGTTPGFAGGPSPTDWMGFASALNRPATTPGFGGGPSYQDWQGFLGGLNPQADAINTWFGLNPDELSLLNEPPSTTPGFVGGPSSEDWGAFLNALNPQADAINTWFGLNPEEFNFLYGQEPPQSNTTYDPFTDSSVNMPDYGASYDPYSLENMSSDDMAAYLGLEDWYGG